MESRMNGFEGLIFAYFLQGRLQGVWDIESGNNVSSGGDR